MKETWKPVVGYSGIYEVSNRGRVRSMDRALIQTRRGKRCSVSFIGRIIRPTFMKTGHLSVVLSFNGVVTGFKVHTLVAEAFIRRKLAGEHVHHLDFNPKNNKLENLEITTAAGNADYSMRADRLGTKLKKKQVQRIKLALAKGKKQTALAHQFGVTFSSINAIATGRNWRWVD